MTTYWYKKKWCGKSNLLQNYNSINGDVDATPLYSVLELVHKDEYTERGGGRHTLAGFQLGPWANDNLPGLSFFKYKQGQ